MKKIFFVLIILLVLFIPVTFASEGSMQTLTKTASFSCSGSNRPGGPCEGVYLKKDHKWLNFEIPAFSDYELETSGMECTVSGLGKDEYCINSGHCEVLIEGVGMGYYLPRKFTTEPRTIKVKCTQCRYGGWYFTFYPTNCKVEVKYKNYGSCDGYCKAKKGSNYVGKSEGGECQCIKSEEAEEQQGGKTGDMLQDYEYCSSLRDYEKCEDCCRNLMQTYSKQKPYEISNLVYSCHANCEKLKKPEEENTTKKEDTCFNKKQDEGEEGVDCGGSCMKRCSYSVSISPNTATLFADGKSSQEFILTASSSGSPLQNERFTLSFWFPFNSKVMDTYGQIKPASVTTDENGKASFVYHSPRAPDGKYLKNLNFEIRATGKSGAKAKINLIDPKPIVKIKLDKRSMLEGNEMNFADVTIIDENSKEWSIKITTNIGKLIPTERSGEFNTLVDKVQRKEYHFNWKPPVSAVELIDGTLEYTKDHRNDWSSYTSGLKKDTVNLAVGALPLSEVVEEVESYKSQYETWNGNINQLQRDINRIQTSISSYEKFLRSLSLGLEGLQIFYGTKGFVEGKLGDDSSSSFKEYLEGVRDKTIDYGVDSLQSGLRYWANLVRESNLDTVRIPVYIVVEVTDGEGFTTKEIKVFQYIYHIE